MGQSREFARRIFEGIVKGAYSLNAVDDILSSYVQEMWKKAQEKFTPPEKVWVAANLEEATKKIEVAHEKIKKARVNPETGRLSRRPNKKKRGHTWVRAVKDAQNNVIKTGYWVRTSKLKHKGKPKHSGPKPVLPGTKSERQLLSYYRKRAKAEKWEKMPTTLAEAKAMSQALKDAKKNKIVEGLNEAVAHAQQSRPVERVPMKEQLSAVAARIYQPHKRKTKLRNKLKVV